MSKKALIVVDLQNDFCPGGSLGVPEGDQIIPTVNKLIDEYTQNHDLVVYTKDFHPADHVSFTINNPDGLWPPHCVQNTEGEEFHPDLQVNGSIFYKAFTTDQDSYSGFGGHIRAELEAQSLADYLKEQNVDEVAVVGLALDYCVKSTAIDANNLGLRTTVVLDGTRPVNVAPDDGDKAVEAMKNAGVTVR